MTHDPEWFADEAFWEWSFPTMFPPRRFEQAADEVARILRLSGVEGGAVLDLGCGPGRHSIPLAKNGFAVTGVDRSAFLLGHARRRGEEEGVDVEWIHEDMRVFRRPEAFDLALSIFTSFGYFESPDENREVLENVAASLEPGGKLVLHVLGKEPLARNFVATETTELEDGATLFQHRRVIEDWRRLEARWVLVRGSEAQRYGFRVWIYSGVELEGMLLEAGFAGVELYGDLEGSPYDLDARRLVAVATRGA